MGIEENSNAATYHPSDPLVPAPLPLPRPPLGLIRNQYQFSIFHSLSSLPRPFKSLSRLPTPLQSPKHLASNTSTVSGSSISTSASTSTIRQVQSPSGPSTLVDNTVSLPEEEEWRGVQQTSLLGEGLLIKQEDGGASPTRTTSRSSKNGFAVQQLDGSPATKPPRPGTPDPRAGIPRSKTIGDLAGYFGAYRRKTDSKTDSAMSPHASSSRGQGISPLKAMNSRKGLNAAQKPLPAFTTNIRQVHSAQPHEYWAGRFTALYDRFRTEDLLNKSANRLSGPNEKGKASSKGSTRPPQPDMEDRRIRRVFIHLQSLCVNSTAKDGLKSFQLEYASLSNCHAALPSKDMMEKVGGAWEKFKGIGRRKTSSNLAGL